MLERYNKNPILTAQKDLSWCNKKVYNCAIYKEDGLYRMLFRGVGDDWISHIGLAESTDGISFKIDPLPVLSPLHDWESHGCEDPRMVKLDDTYYVTYTAYDGKVAHASLAYSKDFHNWEERISLFPNWDKTTRENLPANWCKAAAIYPQKINNWYHLLFGDEHIWAAVSRNIIDWELLDEPILSSRQGYFDSAYVEMGPPPIWTDKGWLVLYHGIDSFDSQRVYSLGAALMDANNPCKVIWRRDTPILAPSEPYEIIGLIDVVEGGFETLKNATTEYIQQLANEHKLPKAVFCCGALLEGDKLRLYYSAADTVICTATIDLESVFSND
jgi:predicted GH43/DUF377 family glycosyl hydrolase